MRSIEQEISTTPEPVTCPCRVATARGTSPDGFCPYPAGVLDGDRAAIREAQCRMPAAASLISNALVLGDVDSESATIGALKLTGAAIQHLSLSLEIETPV